MASLLTTEYIIERVEQMLDALFVPKLSAKEFANGCAVLEEFLATHGDSLSQTGTLDEIVEHAEKKEKSGKNIKAKKSSARWQDTLKAEFEEEDDEEKACLICSL